MFTTNLLQEIDESSTMTNVRTVINSVNIEFCLSHLSINLQSEDTCIQDEGLNASKTVIWLGSKYQVDRVGVHAVPALTSTVPIVDSACDIGVVLDSRLTMAAHVGSVRRSAYLHFGSCAQS